MKIITSTKLITTNVGNQALSDELIIMCQEDISTNIGFKIVGRPFGLDKYSIYDLDENNLITSFDKLAQSIANSAKKGISPAKWSYYQFTNLLDVSGTTV